MNMKNRTKSQTRLKNWLLSNKDVIVKLILIGLPMVIQGIVFELQSLTDKAFLGQLDDKYIAVVGATQFPLGTTNSFLVALGTGTTILVAQMFGARKQQGLIRNVKSAMFFNTLISLVFFALWFFAGSFVMKLMSVDHVLLSDCTSCLKVYAFSFLLLGVDTTLQSMLQGIGKTRPILYAGLLKVGVNILLSWILIFGKWGFPRMNVLGAAIGTVVANLFSVILLIIYCFIIKRKEFRLLTDNRAWFDIKEYKSTLLLSMPTGMEYLLWNLSNLVLIRFLNGFNYVATTIYTLTVGIEIIVVSVFSGNSKASMALMGHSIGAGKPQRANKTFYACIIFNLVIVALFTVLFCIIPGPMLSIFTNDRSMVEHAIPFMVFTGFILIPKSMNVLVGSGIRAYSDTRWMLYSQILGSVFVVGLSYILVRIAGLGIIAIYITLFCDETLRAIINFAYFQIKYSDNAQKRTSMAKKPIPELNSQH